MNTAGLLKRTFPILFIVLILLLSGCKGDGIIPPPPNETPIPTDEAPSGSPDGEWIAYTHISIDPNDTTYPTGLYIIDTSGQNRRVVIDGPAYNSDWSPDGQRIAFSGGDIFTITPFGDSLFQVTTVGSAFFPSWSPDGQRIAFDTPFQDPRGANAIWIINLDGTGLHDISEHGTGEWRDPDWSPNGSKIVHLRYIGIGTEEIFVMDTSGGGSVRMTFNSYTDRHPRWAPDGLTIAWMSVRNGVAEVWLMNSDGTIQRRLTDGLYPAWSADSRKLVFARLTPSRDRIVIWKINADGSGVTQLTY